MGATRALGWAALAVLLTAAAVTPGCRAGRSAPKLSDANSVLALRRAVASAPGPLSARGRAIVRLRSGEKESPALGVAFSLREAGELGLVLRPGVLPPVLSLWAGLDGWLLTLPRERTAFEAEHEPGRTGILAESPPAIPEASTTLAGPTLAAICAWLLGPHTLLAALTEADLRDVRSEGSEWFITGCAPGLGRPDLQVEMRLVATSGAIARWNLRSEDSRELVTVSYDPPREKPGCGRKGDRIHFALPSAALAGTLTFDYIRCTAPGPRQRPAIPEGWVTRPGRDLLPALARLQADLETES